MLVAGRVVAGLSIGVASTIVPIYQAEIAPKEIRGRVISLQQWAITWGILIQYFIQYGASFVDGGPDNVYQGTAAFRIPWGIQTVPAAVLFVGMFFLPLSPRWLAKQDRWEESIQVLADLHGGGDMNHPKVLAQYREIEKALGYEREQARTPWAVLTERKMLRRVFLGMSIQMWSQLSGVNVLVRSCFFSVPIFSLRPSGRLSLSTLLRLEDRAGGGKGSWGSGNEARVLRSSIRTRFHRQSINYTSG